MDCKPHAINDDVRGRISRVVNSSHFRRQLSPRRISAPLVRLKKESPVTGNVHEKEE